MNPKLNWCSFIFYCCIIFQTQTQAQNQSILLDFQGIEDNQSTMIINTLQQLRNIDSKQPMFSNVANLGTFQEQAQFLTDVRLTLKAYTQGRTAYILEADGLAEQEKILKQLVTYDFLLRVEVIANQTIEERLVYRFQLFEVLKGRIAATPQEGILAYPITTDNIRRAEVTITDLDSRTLRLQNTIKQLFPSSNAPPKARMSINNKIKEKKIYHLALGDSLLLDATLSDDQDNKRIDFSYKWEQRPLNGNLNVASNMTTLIKQTIARQFITPPTTGNYLFTLQINDGIANSNIDSFVLKVIERPQLIPQKTIFRRRPKESLFQQLLNRNTYKKQITDVFTVTINDSIAIPFHITLTLINTTLNKPLYTPTYNSESINAQQYQIEISGKTPRIGYTGLQIKGQFKEIALKPIEYYLIRPEKDYTDLKFGTDIFIAPNRLELPKDSVGFVPVALTLQGGFYLAHWNNAHSSLQIEGGISYFLFRTGQFITSNAAGNIGLKLTSYYSGKPIGTYVSLKLVGFQKRDNEGQLSLVRHYGLGIGTIIKLKNARIEVDLLNFYHNFKKDGLGIGWGMRYVFW